MRLFEEIWRNNDGAIMPRGIWLFGGGGYFEGVKTVGDFSAEKIVLYFSHGGVEVEGLDLRIGKYCDGDLRLLGKIISMRLIGKDEAKI